MPNLVRKINTQEIDEIFTVQYDEDNASLHVLTHPSDFDELPVSIAEFTGVLDDADARGCLRRLFTLDIADALTIQKV